VALVGSGAWRDPYPPVDQKRPPIVLKNHGIFWAGGQIVNRTQTGTENAGDLKDIAINQQQLLVGQAYVEYFIPQKLRNGKKTIPIVLVPGGALIGVHFLTTPDGREGWGVAPSYCDEWSGSAPYAGATLSWIQIGRAS